VLLVFLGLAREATPKRQDRAPMRPAVLRALGETTAQTLQVILRPGWRIALGASAYLLCDVAVLWIAIRALGLSVPAAPLLVAYLVGYLANAVPIPGGLGVLDGGLAGALLAYHVPAATAVGAVLIYHALALWIPTISGTLAFIAALRTKDRARDPSAACHGQRLSRRSAAGASDKPTRGCAGARQ
jgi:uncharacterized membrane protein YbhN (UPF0104 family)